MTKPVQRLDPARVYAGALALSVWVWALEQAAEMEREAEEAELRAVRDHNRRGRAELQRRLGEAAGRDARGEE